MPSARAEIDHHPARHHPFDRIEYRMLESERGGLGDTPLHVVVAATAVPLIEISFQSNSTPT
jgi:hypothetical protein